MNIKKFFDKFTTENVSKSLKSFDSRMAKFSKYLDLFNKGMNDMLQELSFDVKEFNERSRFEEKKNQKNLDKIWSD